MPPPRRRRPVQPATRVRLPKGSRPRGPAAGHGLVTEDAPADTAAAPQDTTAEPQTAAGTEAVETEAAPAAGLADEEGDGLDAFYADDEADGETAEPEGEAEAEDGDGAAAEPPLPSGADQSGGRTRRPMALPAALACVAVILGGAAVWFGLEASDAGGGVDTQNVAQTNAAATRQVSQQVTSAVNTVFSYNYADTAKTRQAAQTLLTGKAIQQYNTLFKLVEKEAPSEKLVLTTTVTNAGVEMLIGNHAQLLIFADQRDAGASSKQTTDAGAMFSVDALRQDGRWKISNIDTFSAGS